MEKLKAGWMTGTGDPFGDPFVDLGATGWSRVLVSDIGVKCRVTG